MAYLSSDKVYIYPVFNRQGTINQESKLNTEFNLTAALSSIISENGGCFVIDWTSPIMKLFMHGYYVELTLENSVSPSIDYSSGNWYAHLYLSDNRGGAKYKNIIEVDSQDDNNYNLDPTSGINTGKFIGIEVDNSSTGGTYKLQILSSGSVPASSYWKFSQKDVKFNPNETTSTALPVVVYDDTLYEIKQLSLSGSATLTDDGTGTTFISSLEQSPSGKVFGTTKSFSIATGTNQGQIQLNGSNINVKDLNTTSSPLFKELTLGTWGSTIAKFTLSGITLYKDVTLNGNTTINGFNLSSTNFEISKDTTTKIYLESNTKLQFNKGTNVNTANITYTSSNSSSANASYTFYPGSYSSVSTSGSESITVANNTFNVVTRNTNQTISGDKTFSGTLKLSGLSSDTSTSSTQSLLTIDSSNTVKKHTGTIGSYNTPIYLSGGTAIACTQFAGGTQINLNDNDFSGAVANIYAPTFHGVSGQILKSNGSGNAPEWINYPHIYEHRFRWCDSGGTNPDYRVYFSILSTESNSYISGETGYYDKIKKIGKVLYNMYVRDFSSALAVSGTGPTNDKQIVGVAGTDLNTGVVRFYAKNSANDVYALGFTSTGVINETVRQIL